jgi:hypothetical protein
LGRCADGWHSPNAANRSSRFHIEPAESGYEVLDEEGMSLGWAACWEEAQSLVPDGMHAVSTPMHGIVLDDELKRAILSEGFFVWERGSGKRRPWLGLSPYGQGQRCSGWLRRGYFL